VTLWQRAVAIHYRQLLKAEQERTLTEKERKLVDYLKPHVEQYEAGEKAKGAHAD
jgi:hypothetical protein